MRFLLIVFLFVSVKAWGKTSPFTNSLAVTNCLDNLSKYQDSHAFKLSSDERSNDDLKFAKKMIEKSMTPYCDISTIEFSLKDQAQNGCMTVVPRNPTSFACYLETNIGFFFVTSDFMDSTFVIWNRWD
jgi:hypothetical protein